MSAEQPTVLPWHREAAKDPHAAELIHAKQEWAIWERNVAACEKEIATLRSQHAETLRLLREADEVLCDVSRYPVASAYPDGPCLERETHDNVCKLLIAIRAHLAAHSKPDEMKGSQ